MAVERQCVHIKISGGRLAIHNRRIRIKHEITDLIDERESLFREFDGAPAVHAVTSDMQFTCGAKKPLDTLHRQCRPLEHSHFFVIRPRRPETLLDRRDNYAGADFDIAVEPVPLDVHRPLGIVRLADDAAVLAAYPVHPRRGRRRKLNNRIRTSELDAVSISGNIAVIDLQHFVVCKFVDGRVDGTRRQRCRQHTEFLNRRFHLRFSFR